MKSSLRNQEKTEAIHAKKEALRLAAKLLGSVGGSSGTGKAKSRPSEVCRAAINKRWDTYRKEKMARRNIKAD